MKRSIQQEVVRGICLRNNTVLLVNKIGEPHHFLPGGRVEAGESVEHALEREIREELGKECKISRPVGRIEHAFETPEAHYYEMGHFFLIDIPALAGTVISAEKELTFRWANLNTISSLDLRPEPAKKLLHDLRKNPRLENFYASTIQK